MKTLNAQMEPAPARPVKVLQFGEGNFLRAFVDYMLDIANEKGVFDGSVVLVKPIPFGNLDSFHKQDCRYTVMLRGNVNGEAVTQTRRITSVADAVDSYAEYDKYAAYAKLDTLRYIVSNTTEAGIVLDESDRFELTPPNTYPGKLTKFLYERAVAFDYAPDKGLVMLPVELIDDNGIELKRCVTALARSWQLGDRFMEWLESACVFTSTLVDRIVTGYPKDEIESIWQSLGYEDRLLVTGEPFALWVIESSRDLSGELRLRDCGLPVIFTDNQKPYKQRKVRILNGAHTSFVPASFLCGHDTVLESMRDPLVKRYIERTLYDEVIPTLSLPKADLMSFAQAVIGRFENPFIKHSLLAICLNCVSKWRARCMPSLLGYVVAKKELPPHLTFSLAAIMALYHGGVYQDGALLCERDGQPYTLRDDESVLRFFAENNDTDAKTLAERFIGNAAFFGDELAKTPGLVDAVSADYADILADGMRATLEKRFGANQ